MCIMRTRAAKVSLGGRTHTRTHVGHSKKPMDKVRSAEWYCANFEVCVTIQLRRSAPGTREAERMKRGWQKDGHDLILK